MKMTHELSQDEAKLLLKKAWLPATVYAALLVVGFVVVAGMGLRFPTSVEEKTGKYMTSTPVPTAFIAIFFMALLIIGVAVIGWWHWGRLKKLSRHEIQREYNPPGKIKSLRRTIQWRYIRNFLLSFSIYTVVMVALVFTAIILKDNFIWYRDSPSYAFLSFARDYFFLILLVLWVGGAVVLMFFEWRACSADIVGLVAAIEEMEAHPEERVHVPSNLIELQPVLQEVQDTSLRNQRAAKEAEQRKNDLIVYLAHDLKTPLTSVLGYLGLLRDEQEISEETRQRYIGIAASKAERLETLINEFFEITRYNLQGLELQRSRFNLSRMLEQLCSEFEPVFAPKKLKTELDIQPDIEVVADPGKLERVLDNLLRNAANYSDAGSTVHISAARQNGMVALMVKNQGDTIPEYKQEHVFEQFYRVDESRSTQEAGSGLGLAIAKEIIERHGGSITVSSENRQTVFTVLLPDGIAPVL